MRIQGVSGSRGVAVGNVYRYIQEEIVIPDYTVVEDKVEAEIGKVRFCYGIYLKTIGYNSSKGVEDMGPEEAAIFLKRICKSLKTHLCLMVLNPLLSLSHTNVVAATAQTIETFANIFLGMEDPYMRERGCGYQRYW